MDHLQEFEGKKFKDATRGDLELGGLASADDKEKAEAQLKESKSLLKRVKDSLGERVSEVRVSTRLKDSAAVLVAGEHDLSAPLRRALEAAGQARATVASRCWSSTSSITWSSISRSARTPDEFGELALVLFEQATLAEGAQLAGSRGLRAAAQQAVDAASIANVWIMPVPHSTGARQ